MRRPATGGSGLSVVVVGGSHAGLMAAIALQDAGARVVVLERSSARLAARGAGLRIQPLMARLLADKASIDLGPASTFTRFDRHIGPGNRVVHDAPELGQFVSWSSLYRLLLERLGPDRYRLGATCVGLEPHQAGVDVRLADGSVLRADLVVCADGIASSCRRQLLPEVGPVYAGYVAWRGLVAERRLSQATCDVIADACTFTVAGLSHMPIYPVPGDDGDGRLINFIWYRNVAAGAELESLMTGRDGVHRPLSLLAGMVRDTFIEQLRRDAAQMLPPAAAEVIDKAPGLFVQPIFDLIAEPIVFDRIVLLGDAAAVTRPHVGAGTTKAALAAWELAELVAAAASIEELRAGLPSWQRRQIELARELIARGAMMGRRAQVEGTFTPGAPELSRITLAPDAPATSGDRR